MLPHEQRNFVHRRIGGAISGFAQGGLSGAIGGFAGGGPGRRGLGGRRGRLMRAEAMGDPLRGTFQDIQSRFGFTEAQTTSFIESGGQVPGFQADCPAGWGIGPSGQCEPLVGGVGGAIQRFLPGGATGFGGVGQPGEMTVVRRVCQRRHVLGADGMCYPKNSISNRDRWWPAPRKPLLTGGDLNAIAKAARAARRIQTTTKRLQKIGMLPKPKSSRRPMKAPSHVGHHGGTLKVVEEITH